MDVSSRKADHLELALRRSVAGPSRAGWDDVTLVPDALPELALDDVDLATPFLGRDLGAPLLIAGMTGGHPAATDINAELARAARDLGFALGVGSQRAALVDPRLIGSYSIVREHAPDAFVVANIGAAQLIGQEATSAITRDRLDAVVDMVRADALAVHLNWLEELVQTEGDRRTGGVGTALAAACRHLPVPVIAKETGGGMAAESAARLARTGVAAIDVGGAGGANFALIEAERADAVGDERGARVGRTFAGWGVPTAAAILETRAAGPLVIASGGIRHGLDVAKALALGADLVGIGRIALGAVRRGPGALVRELRLLVEELRMACLLCGARTPRDLRDRPLVITGLTRAWMSDRELRR